jgi:uncharacterized membrane protein
MTAWRGVLILDGPPGEPVPSGAILLASTDLPSVGGQPFRATTIILTPVSTAPNHPLAHGTPVVEAALARTERGGILAALPSILIGLVWVAYTSWSSVAELVTFNSTSRDIGVYLQLLWNTGHGRPYQITLLEANRVHLAEHVALLASVLAPVYAVVPDARWLFTAQTAVLGLAAAPIYLLARRLLGGIALPTLFVAAYFAMPALTEVAYDAFYPVTWTALPIAFAAYFLLTGRVRSGTALALAALLMEEEAGLAVLGLGLFLLLRPGQRRVGAALCGVAALWLGLVALVVMPRFHEPSTLPAAGENRTVDHFHALFANPGAALTDIALHRVPIAARWLLVPTGGLPLLAPSVLVIDLPQAATLILADKPDRFRRHWSAPILPTIWLGSVVGFASLRRRGIRTVALGLLVAGTVACYLIDSNLPGGGDYDPSDLIWSDRAEQMAYLVARVPPGASVAASRRVLGVLSNRAEIYVFPPSYGGKLWPPERRVGAYLFDLTNDGTLDALIGRQSPLRATRPYAFWLSGDSGLLLLDRAPEPRNVVDLEVGGLLLRGLDARQAGSTYEVEAHWQAPSRIGSPRQRVVRLLDDSGTVLGEQVGFALDDLFPLQEWPAGQVVVERSRLAGLLGVPTQVEIGWRDEPVAEQTIRLPLRLTAPEH